MIRVDRIERILRTIAVTPSVNHGRGLSVVLIAPSDGGKSQLLKRNLPAHARVINDFTFASLAGLLKDPKRPRFIVVPDFNVAISHKPAVAALAMSLLLPLLGEGVDEIPGLDGQPRLASELRRAKRKGIRVDLITAMTPEMFQSKRGKWRETGLIRRLVPLFYTYSIATQRAIQTSIRTGGDGVDYSAEHHKSPRQNVEITIPAGAATQLQNLSETVQESQLVFPGRRDPVIEYAFSVHKTLRTYARACAYLLGDRSVGARALGQTRDFAAFVRYDRPERI